MTLIETLKSKKYFRSEEGVTEEQIRAAEIELNLHFADDYIDYVRAFGTASYEGHELTGICSFESLNVVEVTQLERSHLNSIPASWYVIEQVHIDGIVIWQATSGEIYRTVNVGKPKLINNSLLEYIEER